MIWLVWGTLAFMVAMGAIVASHRKPLWYDEMFSVIVALQPNWHSTAGALPPDGNPPMYALLARVCIHLFGVSDTVVRLPSFVAFLAALLGVFVFVRRECGSSFGLLATALVFSEPTWTYSYEARPYALLLAWLMLALVSWQSATRETSERRLALFGLAVAIAGSVLSHNLGLVVVGFPLLCGEATRIRSRRRMDWPLLATGLAAIPALAFTIPMIRRTNSLLLRYQHNYLHPLTWQKFVHYGIVFPMQSFPNILSNRTLGFMAILVTLSWVLYALNRLQGRPGGVGQNAGHRLHRHILAASIGCTLLMPVTWLLMMSTSGYYLCRYGIGSALGLALVTCLLVHRWASRSALLPLALAGILAYDFCSAAVSSHETHPIFPTDQLVYGYRTDLPVVVNDPYRYLPMWWYAPASVKKRLVYLRDEPAALQGGYVIIEAALVAEGPYFAGHFADIDSFLASHDTFIFDFTGTANLDLRDRIAAHGFTFTFLKNDHLNGSLYEAHRVHPAGGSGGAAGD